MQHSHNEKIQQITQVNKNKKGKGAKERGNRDEATTTTILHLHKPPLPPSPTRQPPSSPSSPQPLGPSPPFPLPSLRPASLSLNRLASSRNQHQPAASSLVVTATQSYRKLLSSPLYIHTKQSPTATSVSPTKPPLSPSHKPPATINSNKPPPFKSHFTAGRRHPLFTAFNLAIHPSRRQPPPRASSTPPPHHNSFAFSFPFTAGRHKFPPPPAAAAAPPPSPCSRLLARSLSRPHHLPLPHPRDGGLLPPHSRICAPPPCLSQSHRPLSLHVGFEKKL